MSNRPPEPEDEVYEDDVTVDEGEAQPSPYDENSVTEDFNDDDLEDD